MSVRRQLSWRARQGSQRLREGGRRAAVTCWGDFTTPNLIPLKLTFFIMMGSTQCVAPFVSLFLRVLGLTVQEAGFVFAIGPLLPVFAPLIATLIAYKLINFRCVLVFTVALSGFVALINLAISPARTTPHYTNTLSFSVTCNPDFVLTPILTKDDNCDFLEKTVTLASVEAKNCGYMCNPPAVSLPQALLKDVKKLRAKQTASPTLYHICKIQGGEEEVLEQKCFRKNLNKSLSHENMPKSFHIHNIIVPLSKSQITNGFRVKNYTMSAIGVRSVECFKGKVPKKISIPRTVMQENIPQDSTGNGSVTCKFHCHTSIFHNQTCHKRIHSIEHNVALTFWLFVSTNILNKFLIGLTYTMFEVAVVAILKERDRDYGLQRIYGSFGGMLFAPLSGFFIDYFGKGGHYTDYFVMFALYCAVKMVCALMLMKIDLSFRTPAKSIRDDVCGIFANYEVLVLLSIVFIAGMCYGFIENFLPWHLADIGSPHWFIGLLTTIASLSALPFLGFSGSICKKFGYFQSIAFGLVCYSIRFIGYSLVQEYYWCAPFEVLEGVTTGLLYTAAVVYGAQLSSKNNVATLQGVLATCHYGLGKSAGSLLGSFLMAALNARLAFQIFSGMSLISAFFYYLLGKLFILPRQKKQLWRRRAVMNMPIETISRREYKKRNKLNTLPEVEDTKAHKKKRQSPRPPTNENEEDDTKENCTMDDTQMTDLPIDELPTQDDINDDITAQTVTTEDFTTQNKPPETLPVENNNNGEIPSTQNHTVVNLASESNVSDNYSAPSKTDHSPDQPTVQNEDGTPEKADDV